MTTSTSARQRGPRKTINSAEAYRSIVDAARVLRIRCALPPGKQNRARDAAAVLQQPQSSRGRQDYRLVLHDVHNKCGPHGVFLTAVELGQHKVITMRKNDRAVFIETMAKNKDDPSISCAFLRSLAEEYGIPSMLTEANIGADEVDEECPISSNSESSSILDQDAPTANEMPGASSLVATRRSSYVGQFCLESSEGTWSDGSRSPVFWTGYVDSNICSVAPADCMNSFCENLLTGSSLDTAQEIKERASLDGIAGVFDEHICTLIRKVPAHNDDKGSIGMASVTAFFPGSDSTIDCLLSLDIYETGVPYLAQVLFNAKVVRSEQGTHITLGDGTKLILPDSDTTIKGAREEALFAVFGYEISNAVNTSNLRRRERQEGKRKTDCVSMNLMSNGAIINLSLGLEGGREIIRRLYT